MDRKKLVIGFLRLLARLPLPVVHGLGTLCGYLLWVFPNSVRKIARTNLSLCFPNLDNNARNRLLRRNLIETGKTMMEFGPLWLWAGRRVLELIRSVEGEEAYREAIAQYHSIIIMTPHLGAWEITSLYVSTLYPTTILYRPSRLEIDDFIRRGRERLGARAVPTDTRGVRTLLQALHQGGVIGILPDQDPGSESGIFAPFFGHPANTMVLVSRLAIKHRIPVFIVHAERLPRSKGYRLFFQALPPCVSRGSLEKSVTAVNHAVEQAIRRLPEQYLWAYKRFKTRPPGTPKIYR